MEPNQVPTPPPAPSPSPKTDGLAVTSLVLGICGIFCCFFYGIVAIILALKSRKQIKQSNGTLTGAGLALAGLITGYVSLALAIVQIIAIGAALLLPAVSLARERARGANCTQVMKSISLVCKAYATDDENGMLPPDFKALMPNYITDPRIFVCPSAPNASQPIGDNLNRDYVYFGAGHQDAEFGPTTVLIADYHHQRFVSVVFGDGHSEYVPIPRGTDFRTIAAKRGWKVPGPK